LASRQIMWALCAHCLWKSQQDVAISLIPHILKDDYYADNCAVLHIAFVGWVVTFWRTRCVLMLQINVASSDDMKWVHMCI